jgi:hypothetical protein
VVVVGVIVVAEIDCVEVDVFVTCVDAFEDCVEVFVT